MVSTVACYRWGPEFKSRQERELIYFLLKRKFNLFKFEYHHSVGLWTEHNNVSNAKRLLLSTVSCDVNKRIKATWYHNIKLFLLNYLIMRKKVSQKCFRRNEWISAWPKARQNVQEKNRNWSWGSGRSISRPIHWLFLS